MIVIQLYSLQTLCFYSHELRNWRTVVITRVPIFTVSLAISPIVFCGRLRPWAVFQTFISGMIIWERSQWRGWAVLLTVSSSLMRLSERSCWRMSGACEFRLDCQGFLDRLADKLHQTVNRSSPVSHGINCFCPELLLDDNDVVVFDLLAKLVRCFNCCVLLSSSEVDGSKAELHANGGSVSSDV